MLSDKYIRLVNRGLINKTALDEAVIRANLTDNFIEDVLLERDIPKHEILLSAAEFHNMPFVEFEENITVSRNVLSLVDYATVLDGLWMPLSVYHDKAEVLAYEPDNAELADRIKSVLNVSAVEFRIGMPRDIIRIIENNFDLNPGFPPPAGRTPLAKVRTYLADVRSRLAEQRTSLARGRTGLSFLRTGIAFITISITLLRVFGGGFYLLMEIPLMVLGAGAVVDGLRWYIPMRRCMRMNISYPPTNKQDGFSSIVASYCNETPEFSRTDEVPGADRLRRGWDGLPPVQRRRFLANDRTDLAEERTVLASLRTGMAKARTGLAFTRTGIAFAALGVVLLRQFKSSDWVYFDFALIAAGVIMSLEGLLWYIPGKRAGSEGLRSVLRAQEGSSIWDSVFPPFYRSTGQLMPPVKPSHEPGVWATTGVALERTVLADRRNLMARLRTVMARSRTAMAFMRTGISLFAVGSGLMIYFGVEHRLWAAFDLSMIILGMALIINGVLWYVPAERLKSTLPYCFGDMEITIPDYSVPARQWRKVVFSHDDIQ